MMTCPSCGKEGLDLNTASCDQCGWNFKSSPKPPLTIVGSIPRTKQTGFAHIGLGIDITGSSIRYQNGVKEIIKEVFTGIEQHGSLLKIFFYSYGDLDSGQDIVLQTDGGGSKEVIEDLNMIQFKGGAGPRENHLDAIEQLMNSVPWSPGVHNAIIGFMNDESKPTHSGLSAEALGQELKKQNIKLYLVCEVTPRLYTLAKAAGGLIFPISNTPDLDEVRIIVKQLTASLQSSLKRGDTKPMAIDDPLKTNRDNITGE